MALVCWASPKVHGGNHQTAIVYSRCSPGSFIAVYEKLGQQLNGLFQNAARIEFLFYHSEHRPAQRIHRESRSRFERSKPGFVSLRVDEHDENLREGVILDVYDGKPLLWSSRESSYSVTGTDSH